MHRQKLSTSELLKSLNLKSTPQRVMIYDVMKELGHASADMVYKRLNDRFEALTVATVYNVLELFFSVGLVNRRFSRNNKMYFDITTSNHIHLYDLEENSYSDFFDENLLLLVEGYLRNKKIKDFVWDNVDIQIVGHRGKGVGKNRLDKSENLTK